ncbi:MAG: ferredoxin [Legionellales bacterium]|nr:ferredoxin [Legionellales bacterium]
MITNKSVLYSGLSIEAMCGEQGICHVYVDLKWITSPPSCGEADRVLVEDSCHFQDNSRLSCQLEYTNEMDGLSLQLAPE